MGRFEAIRLLSGGVSLDILGWPDGGYRVDNRARRHDGEGPGPTVVRHFKIAASDTPLVVVLGSKAADTDVVLGPDTAPADGVTLAQYSADGREVQRPQRFTPPSA